jgi:membrane protein DedA with SNARE-associated domain
MESLDPFIRAYGYPAVFGGMVIQQVVPPIPGEPLLLGVGALAGNGRFSLWLVVLFALAGSVVGDFIWYEIGRRGRHRIFKWLCRVSIEPDACVRRAQDTLARRGASALLIGKVVPAFNGIAQPLAGALGMSRLRFLIADLLGGILWVGLYIGLGYAFRDQLATAALLANRLGGWAIVIIVGVLGLYLGIKVVRRQLFVRKLRMARISPEELAAKLSASEAVFIVDLRSEIDVNAEPTMIRGAVHMAPASLEYGHVPIPRDREVVLYCS